ncbi:hypothetical protein AWC18_04150 [Mycolicibacter nonchromogenicus]|uniref:Uncharacterized protein n=1 Tax=Mycolicibacter nonchromogenicus TaxID=1782 RepID=A0A1X1ZJY4_MYCNO|nr:hypothetical protein [Mycolicibacter nonchromogenicus]ORW23669.1 hypothetical protein AWC18_04150 [Mycolicibacter nonchromogenicus]
MSEPFRTAAARDLDIWIAATCSGGDPSLSLVTRHPWGDMLGAMLAKIIALTAPAPKADLMPNTGDYRRATALACAIASEDELGIDTLILEAAEAGRIRHTLLASACSVAQGMRADTQPGMDLLRRSVAQLAAIEDQEQEKKQDD